MGNGAATVRQLHNRPNPPHVKSQSPMDGKNLGPRRGGNGKYFQVPKSLARRKDLSSNDKMVLVVLADYERFTMRRGNGATNPGLRRLAEDSGLSSSTVCDSIKRLAAVKPALVKVETVGAGRTRNEYHTSLCPTPGHKDDNPDDASVREPDTRDASVREPSTTAPVVSESRAHQEQDTKNKQHTKNKSALAAQIESIYQAYPKKRARPAALIAIGKALEKLTADELLAHVRTYAESVQPLKKTDEWRFVPYPATWFNNERWKDDLDSTATRPGRVDAKPGAFDGQRRVG